MTSLNFNIGFGKLKNGRNTEYDRDGHISGGLELRGSYSRGVGVEG